MYVEKTYLMAALVFHGLGTAEPFLRPGLVVSKPQKTGAGCHKVGVFSHSPFLALGFSGSPSKVTFIGGLVGWIGLREGILPNPAKPMPIHRFSDPDWWIGTALEDMTCFLVFDS